MPGFSVEGIEPIKRKRPYEEINVNTQKVQGFFQGALNNFTSTSTIGELLSGKVNKTSSSAASAAASL